METEQDTAILPSSVANIPITTITSDFCFLQRLHALLLRSVFDTWIRIFSFSSSNNKTLPAVELYVSEVSIGGGGLGGMYGEFDRQEGIKAIDLALRSGVNLIDTSPWYGQGRSEQLIGEVRGP